MKPTKNRFGVPGLAILALSLSLWPCRGDALAGEGPAAAPPEAGCPGCMVVGESLVDLPVTGIRIRAMKLHDPKTGETQQIATDLAGNVVDAATLVVAEKDLRWDLVGSVDLDLASVAAGSDPDDWLPVFVWGKGDFPVPKGEQSPPSPLQRIARFAAVEEVAAASRSRVVTALEEAGVVAEYEVPGAPLVHAIVKPPDLYLLYRHPAIASIDLDLGAGGPTSTTDWLHASEAHLPHVWGIRGSGDVIALTTVEQPSIADYATRVIVNDIANEDGPVNSHATWALGFIRSRPGVIPGLDDWDQGIAPSSIDFMANSDGYPGLAETWAMLAGADVLVYARGASSGSLGSRTNHDKFVDYYAREFGVLVVASAGNRNSSDWSGYCTSGTYVQNKFFNGLVVGGTSHEGTRSRTDDILYACSSYTNPSVDAGHELPHVVAPADDGESGVSAGGYRYEGTSASAAIVGGIATLVHDENGDLIGHPEATRAIIMATAWQNVDSGYLSLSWTEDEKDGVGEVSAARAVTLAAPGNRKHGGQTAVSKGFDYNLDEEEMDFPGDFPSNWYRETYNVSVPPYSAIQAVLAWGATSTCTDYTVGRDCGTTEEDRDLDLYLKDGSGNTLASSASGSNAYEYVRYYNDSAATLQLLLKVYWYPTGGYPATRTPFGIAWDTWQPATCQMNDLCEELEGTAVVLDSEEPRLFMPAATRLSNGEWVVAWPLNWQEAPLVGRAVYAQRLDTYGSPVGDRVTIDSALMSEISGFRWVDVAALDDGGYVVAYDAMDATTNEEEDVLASVHFPSDLPTPVPAVPFMVNPDTWGLKYSPSLVPKGHEFRVNWIDDTAGSVYSRRCTHVVRGHWTGSEWTGGFSPNSDCGAPVEVATAIGTGNPPNEHDRVPSALLSDGRFVVAWPDYDDEPTCNKVRVFNWTTASPVGSAISFGTATHSLDIAPLGTDFVVVWDDAGYQPDRLMARVFRQDGSTVCSLDPVNAPGWGASCEGIETRVAAVGSTEFRVSWPTLQCPVWKKFSTQPVNPPGDMSCTILEAESCVDDPLFPVVSLEFDTAVSGCCASEAIVAMTSPGPEPTDIVVRVLPW